MSRSSSAQPQPSFIAPASLAPPPAAATVAAARPLSAALESALSRAKACHVDDVQVFIWATQQQQQQQQQQQRLRPSLGDDPDVVSRNASLRFHVDRCEIFCQERGVTIATLRAKDIARTLVAPLARHRSEPASVAVFATTTAAAAARTSAMATEAAAAACTWVTAKLVCASQAVAEAVGCGLEALVVRQLRSAPLRLAPDDGAVAKALVLQHQARELLARRGAPVEAEPLPPPPPSRAKATQKATAPAATRELDAYEEVFNSDGEEGGNAIEHDSDDEEEEEEECGDALGLDDDSAAAVAAGRSAFTPLRPEVELLFRRLDNDRRPPPPPPAPLLPMAVPLGRSSSAAYAVVTDGPPTPPASARDPHSRRARSDEAGGKPSAFEAQPQRQQQRPAQLVSQPAVRLLEPRREAVGRARIDDDDDDDDDVGGDDGADAGDDDVLSETDELPATAFSAVAPRQPQRREPAPQAQHELPPESRAAVVSPRRTAPSRAAVAPQRVSPTSSRASQRHAPPQDATASQQLSPPPPSNRFRLPYGDDSSELAATKRLHSGAGGSAAALPPNRRSVQFVAGDSAAAAAVESPSFSRFSAAVSADGGGSKTAERQRSTGDGEGGERSCRWCKKPAPVSHDERCALRRVQCRHCGAVTLLRDRRGHVCPAAAAAAPTGEEEKHERQ